MFGMQLVSQIVLVNELKKELTTQKHWDFLNSILVERDGREQLVDDVELEFKINDELDVCILMTSND